ncbi:MAG: hypothetical protein JWO54_253 [Candidatus Saccharibacteria bacterium]|nr:hypothetical protein [Candidatus Saccharibacteria bacterium]
MYTLKSLTKRGALLGAAGALLVATILPGASAFADALNPLTERSLMLSSSAPGFIDTDGSGNSATSPNSINQNYAPAGSGPNGKKTGETFTFTVSSNANVKGFSLQYCTTAAGNCQSPGNNTGDADPNNDGSTADSTRIANDTATTGGWALNKSDFDFTGAWTQGTGPGQYQIYVNNVAVSSAWSMTAANLEDFEHSGALTGKDNYIILTSAAGETLADGNEVRVVFRPSESIFITNPGTGSFFVKLNTYSSESSLIGSHNDATPAVNTDTPSHTVIDGGVTVANVMTDSIHITTKVLETMAFSVGTRNRDTLTLNCDTDFGQPTQPAGCEAASGAAHGTCSPVQNVNNNRLNLGNPDAEYSLETSRSWDVSSYWRLSSNSSGGATVYYSGDTLRNTVGDSIDDVETETLSTPGTEQFGLGFVAPEAGSTEFQTQRPGLTPTSVPFVTLLGQSGAGFPVGQNAAAAYDEASGTPNVTTGSDLYSPNASPGTAKFKFLETSLTTPEPIAQQNTEVVRCATAKMRYVGNIAADTPAGVYTTKINYLAAPQY